METVAAHRPVHLQGLAICPFLPLPQAPLTAKCMSDHAHERGVEFYQTSLLYSQSLWLQGYPARAVLLLNHALGGDLTGHESILASWPLPYKAAAWILRHHLPDQFIGNPRRHWQHLATRMVEPRKELRGWRAWACWRIACILLPDMPGDDLQIAREGICEPGEEQIAEHLDRLGLPHEVNVWRDALNYCRSLLPD